MENTFLQPPPIENLKSAISEIKLLIADFCIPNNKKLIEICRQNAIELVGKNNDSHLIHELLETAVNLHLSEKLNPPSLQNEKEKLRTFKFLTEIMGLMPPQSWRSNEQTIFQQFSTPPAIAFVMAQILKPEKGKSTLEPSAGTGSLAVWLKIAGCLTFVNEISERRRELLKIQNYEPTKVDAEFLNDLLPAEIKPDFVLMNPPFSLTGGRCKKSDSNFGFRHVKSALARLKEGGRLVALLGSDTVTKTAKGRIFLSEITDEYDLKAVITLPKNAFYKYGTNFQTCIVCIKKPEILTDEKKIRQSQNVLEANCRTLEECLAFTNIFDQ